MRKTKQQIRQELIDIRQARVLEYLSTGYTSHREIAKELHVHHDTIDRDVKYLSDAAQASKRNHFQSLPFEIKKAETGIELTIKQLTEIINTKETPLPYRLDALNARMDAYRFRMDILDGKGRLDEIWSFIEQQQQQQSWNQTEGFTDGNGKLARDVSSSIPEHD